MITTPTRGSTRVTFRTTCVWTTRVCRWRSTLQLMAGTRVVSKFWVSRISFCGAVRGSGNGLQQLLDVAGCTTL